MSLSTLLIVWGVVTAVLVVLLIYRSTISMREDDQLFLDDTESNLQKEQTAVLKRLHSLQLPVRVLGGVSGALILVIFGLWLWRGINGT
jgi:hypothetical protein